MPALFAGLTVVRVPAYSASSTAEHAVTLATSVSPRCIGINFTSRVDQYITCHASCMLSQWFDARWLLNFTSSWENLKFDVRCPGMYIDYPKDSMHSASSRKHQAWTEWIFCFFGWSKTFGEKIGGVNVWFFVSFITVLFLSNICRVRWFDQSLQSMFSAPKKLGGLLKARGVWK